jgi:hypothetical protein
MSRRRNTNERCEVPTDRPERAQARASAGRGPAVFTPLTGMRIWDRLGLSVTVVSRRVWTPLTTQVSARGMDRGLAVARVGCRRAHLSTCTPRMPSSSLRVGVDLAQLDDASAVPLSAAPAAALGAERWTAATERGGGGCCARRLSKASRSANTMCRVLSRCSFSL